jgi:hypothetical protein
MQPHERLPLLSILSGWCLLLISLLLPFAGISSRAFPAPLTIWEMAQTGMVIFIWPFAVISEPRLLLLPLVPITTLYFLVSPWFAVGSRRDSASRFAIAGFILCAASAALLTLTTSIAAFGPDYYGWLAAQFVTSAGYFWLARADRRAMTATD